MYISMLMKGENSRICRHFRLLKSEKEFSVQRQEQTSKKEHSYLFTDIYIAQH